MSQEDVVARIKQIISDVTSIDTESIGDDATFESLGLDSLSLLEIAVDVDFEFKLGVPDEELRALSSLQDTTELVHRYLAKKQASEVA